MALNEKKLLLENGSVLPAETLASHRPIWLYVAYFLGVPLAVAIYAALNNWEIRQSAGVGGTLVFYMAHALLPWCITCLSTTLAKRALSKWRPPWVALLLIGHFLGSVLVVPYSNWLTNLYEVRFPDLDMASEVAPIFSMGFWMYFLRAGVIWIGVNVLFDRFLHLKLYRYQSGTRRQASVQTGTGSREQPAFFARLPVRIDVNDLISIKAEQHYIQVSTADRQFMVLYRFSDAIRELEPSLGLQVHRSYWVNPEAIEAVHAKARDFYLRMRNGAHVPVSGPYQGLIRELARTRHLEMHR